MNTFLEAHKKMLLKLIRHQVDFILIGGYAVIYYGYSRSTVDMDIWLKPDNTNKQNLLKVLEEIDINENDLTEFLKLNFTKANGFFIGEKPNRIDFLTQITGLEWNECARNVAYLSLEDVKIPVLRFRDLIVNKMLSDSLKDRADIDELQKINKHRKPPFEI